jgi:hypothetical protein
MGKPLGRRMGTPLGQALVAGGLPYWGERRYSGFCEIPSAEQAGELAYGPNIPAMYHRVAFYVDRILKDANAGDLPVEQPSKFDLIINLKTAKALGLTVPPSLLARADEVIE